MDRQSKLAAWRDWRSELAAMPDPYTEVAEWWKFVPLVNKKIDPWRTELWPDPWSLVLGGEFCPNAQGLGMFYSLVLSSVDCELVLAMVEEIPRLMVTANNTKLLNYYDGEVIDMETANLQILQTWTAIDLARLVKV